MDDSGGAKEASAAAAAASSWHKAGVSPLFALLHQHHRQLQPRIFDPLSLRWHKTLAVLLCFDSRTQRSSTDRGGGEGGDHHDPHTTMVPSRGPPMGILRLLRCFDDFRYHCPPSNDATAVFGILYHVLRLYPQLCHHVLHYILDLVRSCPQYTRDIIALIDRYARAPCPRTRGVCPYHYDHHQQQEEGEQNVHSRNNRSTRLSDVCPRCVPTPAQDREAIAIFLLTELGYMLESHPHPPSLGYHFSLMRRIVSEECIDPGPVLRALMTYVRCTDACAVGDFQVGAQILSVCRRVLLTHPLVLVYKLMGSLLRTCATYFPDVDTRDRAHFYYQLMTHVDIDKLRDILDAPGQRRKRREKEKARRRNQTRRERARLRVRKLHKALTGLSGREKPGGDERSRYRSRNRTHLGSSSLNDVERFVPRPERAMRTVHAAGFVTLYPSKIEREAIGLWDGGTGDISESFRATTMAMEEDPQGRLCLEDANDNNNNHMVADGGGTSAASMGELDSLELGVELLAAYLAAIRRMEENISDDGGSANDVSAADVPTGEAYIPQNIYLPIVIQYLPPPRVGNSAMDSPMDGGGGGGGVYNNILHDEEIDENQQQGGGAVEPAVVSSKQQSSLDAFPPQIYSMVLAFSSSPDYHPLKPVCLPYLCPPTPSSQSNSIGNTLLCDENADNINNKTLDANGAGSLAADAALHSNDSNSNLNFPHAYKLVLALRPVAPVPTTFDVQFVFNDASGQLCQGDLPAVSVSFPDLFLCLPVATVFPKGCEFETRWRTVRPWRHAVVVTSLFNSLWDLFGDGVVDAGGGRGGGGVESSESSSSSSSSVGSSMKLLRLPREVVLSKIRRNLGPFVEPSTSVSVSPTAAASPNDSGRTETESRMDDSGWLIRPNVEPDLGEDVDAEEAWYATEQHHRRHRRHRNNNDMHSSSSSSSRDGKEKEEEVLEKSVSDSPNVQTVRVVVFLPPRYHILFKFRVCAHSTLIRMRTDRWQLLSEMDRYFYMWTHDDDDD